jgi:hypothetical protein
MKDLVDTMVNALLTLKKFSWIGEIVRKESPNRIIASADFSGDGHREVLVDRNWFCHLDGKNELNKISLSDDYWYEPIVTYCSPFCRILCRRCTGYDSKLNFKIVAEGALSIACYCFLGEGPNAPFAAIYEGRGGWHMELYVFSSTGS